MTRVMNNLKFSINILNMKKLIQETAKELWIAQNQHETTFEWKYNWFYMQKKRVLLKMLDELIELDNKEIELWKNMTRKSL
jgi:hypothetical protein